MKKDESIIMVEASGSTLKIGANLSKREYFAAMAMQGFCSWDHNKGNMLCDYTSRVYQAVEIADQLIRELEK